MSVKLLQRMCQDNDAVHTHVTMYDVQFLWALEKDSHTAESSALPGILVSCKDHMSTCRSSVFLIKVLAKAVGGK